MDWGRDRSGALSLAPACFLSLRLTTGAVIYTTVLAHGLYSFLAFFFFFFFFFRIAKQKTKKKRETPLVDGRVGNQIPRPGLWSVLALGDEIWDMVLLPITGERITVGFDEVFFFVTEYFGCYYSPCSFQADAIHGKRRETHTSWLIWEFFLTLLPSYYKVLLA